MVVVVEGPPRNQTSPTIGTGLCRRLQMLLQLCCAVERQSGVRPTSMTTSAIRDITPSITSPCLHPRNPDKPLICSVSEYVQVCVVWAERKKKENLSFMVAEPERGCCRAGVPPAVCFQSSCVHRDDCLREAQLSHRAANRS